MATLAVGLDTETKSRINAVLDQHGATVQWVPQASQALELAGDTHFDLVACTYPLPDMALREFGRGVRRPDSASRDAALLVLTLPEMRTEALMGLPSGRALVRSRRDSQPLLSETMRHLLRVAPRRSCTAPVSVEVGDEGGGAKVNAKVVNLSLSGMLVQYNEPPHLHSECSFELQMNGPASLVSGRGTVVRHAMAKRERMQGFAVRFTELAAECSEVIEAFLATAG